jgi:hypothetical protein
LFRVLDLLILSHIVREAGRYRHAARGYIMQRGKPGEA